MDTWKTAPTDCIYAQAARARRLELAAQIRAVYDAGQGDAWWRDWAANVIVRDGALTSLDWLQVQIAVQRCSLRGSDSWATPELRAATRAAFDFVWAQKSPVVR